MFVVWVSSGVPRESHELRQVPTVLLVSGRWGRRGRLPGPPGHRTPTVAVAGAGRPGEGCGIPHVARSNQALVDNFNCAEFLHALADLLRQ
eukprot:3003333-Alexandrium_andersonii.AAC.1